MLKFPKVPPWVATMIRDEEVTLQVPRAKNLISGCLFYPAVF